MTGLSIACLLIIFTQCASSQQVDKQAPITFNSPYYQEWVSGIREGGSGFIVYLPVNEDTSIVLEEVYFKGKKIELERKKNQAVYIGRYTNPGTVVRDLIMSDDPKEEAKNEVPALEEKIPFELQENECMIGYTKNGKKGYFKLDRLPEKQMKGIPMQIRQ